MLEALLNVKRESVTFALIAMLSGCGSDDSPAGGSSGTGATSGIGGASAAGGSGGASATGGTAGGAGSSGAPTSSNVQGLEGGRYHTCLTTKSGAVYCWGQGAYGALGNNGSYRGIPTKALVVDDATDVDCGGRFSCARRASHSLFCWGEDQAGQVGGPSTKECGDAQIDSVCAPVPQAVAGIDDATGIALGRDHACAVFASGTVSCWGSNAQGQLGDANLTDRMQPAPVPGIQGATAVTAGDEHSCALAGSPGKVFCWGQNANGQIGSGSVTPRETAPIEVAGIADAVEVAAGGEHTCARRASGSVACWGYNYFGQLGRGTKQPTRATGASEVLGLNDAIELALGRYHSCARRAGGTIACWGFNDDGAVGDGTTTERTQPIEVVTIADAVLVAAGSWHTCTILASGAVMCWGDNLGGQLGIDAVNKVPNPTPVAVQQLPTD